MIKKIFAIMISIIMTFAFFSVNANEYDISPYGYTRCPRCGIDIIESTKTVLRNVGTTVCVNGYTGLRDDIYNRYEVTIYRCANSGCSWVSQEEAFIQQITDCPHV